MRCPRCGNELEKIEVAVAGAKSKAVSYQCSCGHFLFDSISSDRVLSELSPLKMKQKVICLSQDRLGIYLNKSVIESLNISRGDEVLISVPDRKHIVVELKA